MRDGFSLIQDIDAFKLAHNEMVIWWLGQHSFVVKSNNEIIYIDPFLSNTPGRLISSYLKPEQVTNASYFLGTHDHIDHIDRESWPILACSSPSARFIVPSSIMSSLSSQLNIPRSRFIGLQDLTSVDLGNNKVTGIASAHEFLEKDAQGRDLYLGYVIENKNLCIYHSGDCCIYEGLVSKLKEWIFDLIILPINGRDAKRLKSGCIGNMTYQEAADLTGALNSKRVIPAHYDMFSNNLGPINDFVDYMEVKYPNIKTIVCKYAEATLIKKSL